MLQVCQPCSMGTSCRAPRANRNQSPTRLTAIFTDDWDWTFNSKNHQSRRRSVKSGERISGFTAVFCDNWKDDEDEVETPPRAYEYVPPQSCHSLRRDNDRKRKRGADDFAEFFTSTWPHCKRQCEEYCYPWRASTTFLATSPTAQQYQFHESGSPLPTALESLTPSSIISASDEETFTQGPATPEYPTKSLPSSGRPMAIDFATETERYPYLGLAADESWDPSFALTDLMTKGQDGMMPLSELIPGRHCFPETEYGIGELGVNDWDQFVECSIGDGSPELEGYHELGILQEFGTLQEIWLKYDFEEFKN